MTPQKWRLVAEALAAIGVVASLFFVGLQIRQNTIQARAQAYQEIGLEVSRSWYNDATNPELLEIARRADAGDPLTEVELWRARARVTSILRMWETAWLNVEVGALSEAALNQMGSWPRICDIGLLRADWEPFFRPALGAGFREYVGEVCGFNP